jgi:hypothetical protein
MKYLRLAGLATSIAMALLAIGAGSAAATTIEVGGATKNGNVTIEAEVTAGVTLAKTDGSEANTCSRSSIQGVTTVFSGSKVTAVLQALSFRTCKVEVVTVDDAGELYIEYEGSGTSGSVFSENAEVTVPTTFGFSVTCSTGAGTKLGTLDGVAAGTATLTVNAVLNCGFLLPSATFKGTYKVSSALGVVA